MRIGLLGGAFDPPHNAHIALAEAARDTLNLDTVILMPAGDAPYKKMSASRADRLNMMLLAAEGRRGLTVSDIEIMRPGDTYAADTLRIIADTYPGAEIFYILGADAASRMPRWKRSEEVFALCRAACATREGDVDVPDFALRIEGQIPDISSSEIRRIAALGGNASALMPPEAYRYMRERGLYRTSMPESEIISDLKARLKPSRFQHTMGVVSTATQLAEHFGEDVGAARIAALLHDCAKSMQGDELEKCAISGGADEVELRCTQVLHAPAGAYLARTVYGVTDERIISAIRRHTVGGPGMSALELIVYVADFIEPYRADFEGLSRARDMAWIDLRRAARICAANTTEFARRRGLEVHPATIEMMKEI